MAVLIALPSIVLAQEESSDLVLEQIVVTAQKRAENVQDVPIAISAMGVKMLEERGLTSITQISSYAPNVQLDSTTAFAGSSQVLSATVRGIGQNDFAFNLEPGVGLYIDGVYFARSLGAVADLLDLDHVEVLKGPQGTLFGRNTIGGALNIVTREPADTFQYKAEFTAGSYDRRDIRGSVDLPLIDNVLTAQLSVSSKDREGYAKRMPYPGAAGFRTDIGQFITAAPPGGSQRQGGEDAENVRAKILWRISDDVKLLVSGDYTNVDQEAVPWTLLDTNAGPTAGTVMSLYNACISLPVATLNSLGLGAACGPRATVNTSYAGVNADADPNNDRLPFGSQYITGNIDRSYGRGNNYDRLKAWGVSATLDWDLTDTAKLKSISAVRGLDSTFGADLIQVPFIVNDASFAMGQHQVSQELQFTSTSFDDRLKNLFGVYYFRETGDLIDYPVFAEGMIQIYGPNYFLNKAYAAFVHEELAVTDQLSLTLGGRYTKEDKEFEGQQHDLNSFALKVSPPGSVMVPDPSDPTRYYPLGVNKKSFTDFSPRASVNYRFNDDMLTYLSYSEGFKSGGWTTRLLAPAPGNVAPDFEPETATTYELGLKSQLFDDRVRLNAALFYTSYDDIQVLVYEGISPVFENAGKAVIKGGEIESQALLFRNFTVSLNLGYLDAYYTELRPGTLVTKSFELVNAPEWSGDAGMDYAIDFAGGATLTLHADYSYKSDMARDALNSPYLFSGDVKLVNAALIYASSSGGWEVSLGGRNLTDERYVVAGYDQMAAGQVGDVSATFSRPREWYLSIRIRQ